MERYSDAQLRQRLRGFEPVWQRSCAAKDPRTEAELCGVKLMPRRKAPPRGGGARKREKPS